MADLELSPYQLKALHQALITAFPSSADLERMVYFGLNENLHAVTSGGDLQEIVFRLLTWAQTQGRLSELVTEAGKANPGNSTLQSWMQENSPSGHSSIPHEENASSSSSNGELLTPALLRERLTQGLSRSEVSVMWYDVLGVQMDEEMPGRPQQDCVIELIARADRRNRLPELVAAIGRLYPHVSLSL